MRDYERYSVRKSIEAVKAEVTIEDYLAAHDVQIVRNRARCIVHVGDNPQSFAVYLDQQRWYCFGCAHGGDLIDLCELVERHTDTQTAIVALAMQFGIELPQRPPRWHEWQDEKARIRESAKQYVATIYQRRLTRVYAPLVLVGGETPGEAIEVLEGLASALWPISLSLAGRRVADEEE
jgi:DNA primase